MAVHQPAKVAQRPKQTPPQPDPPSPTEAARLADQAFEIDDDWGTLVWLVMATGVRRGEACAFRWSEIDVEEGLIKVERSYLKRNGISKINGTKLTRCAVSRSTPKQPSYSSSTKFAHMLAVPS